MVVRKDSFDIPDVRNAMHDWNSVHLAGRDKLWNGINESFALRTLHRMSRNRLQFSAL